MAPPGAQSAVYDCLDQYVLFKPEWPAEFSQPLVDRLDQHDLAVFMILFANSADDR